MRRFRLHYVVWVGVLCFLAGVLTACNTVQKNVPEPYKGGPQPWADQPLTASAVTVREGVNYLSDLTWESATNGWGSVERDRSNGEAASGDGRTLTLNGQTFSKGLGAHAASRIVYDLGGQCRSFKASVGMDDEVGSRGSVVFQVFADGNQLYDSGTMTGDTATKTLDINITGKTRLELVVTIAGDNNYYDHANWADARLECSPSTVTSLAGTYQIVAQHSSKCLDVSGVSQRNGTNIQQFTCYTVNNQIWDVKPFGSYYQIIARHSGKCLNVNGGTSNDNERIIQYPCVGADNELWTIKPSSDAYQIIAKHSNKCLNISGASTADSAKAIQSQCAGASSERFSLRVLPAPTSPLATKGQWSSVINLPLVPVAAATLPDGKVLFWSAYDRYAFGGSSGQTYTALFNPSTNQTTEKLVTETGHDMFCPGTTMLSDGRLLVNGGSNAEVTSLYNFSNNTWTRDANMNIPRGYNSTVTLSNGSAFTLGGSWSGGQGGKHGEVWTSGSGWRRPANTLVDPIIGYEDIYRSDNHSWLFSSDNGRVFYAGPGNRMQWYDTNGNGSVTFAGNRGDDTYSQNGNAVMFAPGKILKAGGAAAYERQPANPRSYVIDINGGVTTKAVGSLSYARAFANAVVLADGGVMIVGGMPNPVVFSDTNAVLTPELWSPRTEQWTQLANHQIARTYHSVALLLPDGRVLAGGGGLCGGCGVNHPDAEIFSPPYLFTSSGGLASRPVISTAPTSVGYGQTFNVTLASGRWASGFHLVRLSSLTHSVNNDQRFISLDYGGGAGNYTLTAPANSGIAPGGYYMLFALDSQGVPSVAKIIRLG